MKWVRYPFRLFFLAVSAVPMLIIAEVLCLVGESDAAKIALAAYIRAFYP
jgi:hypothetical protein